MKVVFSFNAKQKLQLIYDYYFFQASEKVAFKIINDILAKIELLKTTPHIGSHEELLKDEKIEYKKLISGNYKIIYHLDGAVFIDTIFDCRQEPDKILKEL